MDIEKLRVLRDQIVQRWGPWTAHDISLCDGLSTMDRGQQQQWRVVWFDHLFRKFGEPGSSPEGNVGTDTLFYGTKTLLDLACLEGLFAIEFARFGAKTEGVEIRDTHLAKANFVKEILNLENCTFTQCDVRKLPKYRDQFDFIICAGILYHLNFPDCVNFIRDIAEKCSDVLIIDSHLAYHSIAKSVLPLSPMRAYEFDGQLFNGREIIEHRSGIAEEEKASVHVWASIDNDISVWLREDDVVRILEEAGFTLVSKAFPNETYEKDNPDRPTLIFKRNLITLGDTPSRVPVRSGRRAQGKVMKLELMKLQIGGTQRDFYLRTGSSDSEVIGQVFVDRAFDLSRFQHFPVIQNFLHAQRRTGKHPLIIDGGANTGASSVYFSAQCTDAMIVSIEPEAENFQLLRANTQGLSVTPLMKALSSGTERVRIVDPGDGAWAFQTEILPEQANSSNGSVESVTVNDIYSEHASGFFPFIVKIDIEGFENNLFSRNTEWLDETPILIVETHDWMIPGKNISGPLIACLAKLDRDFLIFGENIFSIDNRLFLSPQ